MTPGFGTHEALAAAVREYLKTHTYKETAERFNISHSTVYRYKFGLSRAK